MPKFTQDKWVLDERNGIICTDHKGIAKVLFEGTEEGRANARLIAAAPEMYQFLKELEYELHCMPHRLANSISILLNKIDKTERTDD